MVQLLPSQLNLQSDVARSRANQQGVVIAVLDARAADAGGADINARANQALLNQTFSAQVLEQAPGNLAKIQTGNLQLWVKLTSAVNTGSTIQVRLQQAGSAQVANLTPNALLQQTPPLPVIEQDGDVSTALSPTASLINQVLQSDAEHASNAPLALRLLNTTQVATPLLDQPEQFAAQLHGAIEHSGVFYESHLNQWVKGERTLTSLLNEPQNAVNSAADQLGRQSVNGGTTNASGHTATLLFEAPSTAANLDGGNRVNTLDQSAVNLMSIVREQLNMVDSKHMSMQFEAWPKQPVQLQLAVDDEPDPSQSEQTSTAPTWRIQLQLSLPKLGQVEALMSLQGQQLAVKLVTDRDLSQTQLQDARLMLLDRLQSLGLAVATIEVQHGR